LERRLSLHRLLDRRRHRRHVAAGDANLAATKAETIIIPGHAAPVSKQAELQKFRHMLAANRDSVGTLRKKGYTANETLSASRPQHTTRSGANS
jgi:hypothetical protein